MEQPDQPLPDPGTRAPVHFLPDRNTFLLVHARRTSVLPEKFAIGPRIFTSKNPFSVGTVPRRRSGACLGVSLKEGRVVIDPYEPISRDRRCKAAVEDERAALEAFQG